METSVEAMITQYIKAWNETTLESYKREFAKCWSPKATYTDPNFDLPPGVDAISELAVKSTTLFPGRIFTISKMPETHHHYVRYSWSVVLPNETRHGTDVIDFNEEFLITRLVTFFDSGN